MKKYMTKMKKQLAYLLLAATSLLCLWSCSNDDGEAPQLKGTETQVPITITFGGAWDTDNATSRVAPPEQGDGLEGSIDEIDDINRVRIITFRRKDASVAGTANGQFVYDPTNDVVTTCEQKDGDERKEAHAQLVKAYGYEYRVVAIAYPKAQEGWFDLNTNLDGLTFDKFEMTIKGQETSAAGEFNLDGGLLNPTINFHKDMFNVMFTPHFFYGYCHLENSDDPVIKFGETEEEKAAPLTGILYRAVAKVEVNLTVGKYNNHDIKHAALLMDSVYAKTSMSSYDDFLSPKNPYNGKKKYTVVDYEGYVPDEGKTMTMTVYVLPTKTKLGLAIYYTVLGIANTKYGWFSAKDISFADGATGVISPDVHGNEFYFRRNHKYVISGTTNNANFDN